MKIDAIFVVIFIVILTFFIIIIASTQAANYTTFENEYIAAHMGQSIIPYPWDPTTSIRVLPFNYEIPADPAYNFSITACRNQYESASFIINARKDLSGIAISVPTLYNAQGNSIPADEINIRTVKVWYQAAPNDIWFSTPEYYLAPELLLKDDSLVKVDYVTKTNYLKVTVNGVEQYIDISNPNATFPSNARFNDASSLQPFSLKANENKQIWLTVHVPGNTPAGDYYGNLRLTPQYENPIIMNFSVKVLPFDLEPSPIEYAIYYRGQLPTTSNEIQEAGTPNPDFKTSQQYSLELQNMKEHGIVYPTIYNEYNVYNARNQTFKNALSLRNHAGLPTDHIYIAGMQTDYPDLANNTKIWKNVTASYGYKDLYIAGIDEARGDVLRSERPAWNTVHQNGAKTFVAISNNFGAVDIVGDLLDVAVLAGPLNVTQAKKWHSFGKRIFSYANPQAGVENTEIYRINYGFALWNAGYDGAMNYAYQDGGKHDSNGLVNDSIWNDFDTPYVHYRDHVFAYPTSDGVIDTIEWEGWRAGVDDTRYVASLIKKEGNITSAKTIVSSGLANNENMTAIRKKVIDQILILHPQKFG